MIETKDVTKMVSHIIRRDKGIADTQLMHPTREWFIGLGITMLIVLLGSWFCWYIYNEYSQTINTPLTVSESVVPYQAATIAEAIKIYETKQSKFLEILGTSDREVVPDVSTTTEILNEVKESVLAPIPTVVSDPQTEFNDDEESESVLAL